MRSRRPASSADAHGEWLRARVFVPGAELRHRTQFMPESQRVGNCEVLGVRVTVEGLTLDVRYTNPVKVAPYDMRRAGKTLARRLGANEDDVDVTIVQRGGAR